MDGIADGQGKLNRKALLRYALLLVALVIGGFLIVPFIGSQIHFRDYLGDYQLFWHMAQRPMRDVYADFPFPYPPTALLLMRPFGLLPFPAALLAWSGLGLAAMFVAGRRIVSIKAMLVSLGTAAVLGVAIGGQVSLFVAALIIGGLTAQRPWVAGALLGCAAVIKPQSLLAAPIALLAARQYRTIAWATATSIVLGVVTILLWGADTWMRWIVGLRGMPGYLVEHRLDIEDRGLYGLFTQFSLPGWLFLIGIPLGIACAWLAFRSEHRPVDRYAAFAVSTILLSPYTLGYDLAGLTVAAMGLLLDEEGEPMVWLAAALIISLMLANFGVLLLALLYVRERWVRPRPA
jgi:hypothetical protein